MSARANRYTRVFWNSSPVCAPLLSANASKFIRKPTGAESCGRASLRFACLLRSSRVPDHRRELSAAGGPMA